MVNDNNLLAASHELVKATFLKVEGERLEAIDSVIRQLEEMKKASQS
ncbi:hypothetical protein WMW72_34115 [Paenibacillus filicis]|uniref:Uncharacterized protein n=1 Tax=Paenibacillus filicis TaxID=669464 RepID=A0ABU9DXT2_9BACL